MNIIVLILLLILLGIYLLFKNKKVRAEPRFNLKDKVIHNNRPAHIHEIWRGSNDTDYVYEYVLIYEDVWKRSGRIKESDILK